MARAAPVSVGLLALFSLGASSPLDVMVRARGEFTVAEPYSYTYRDPFLQAPPFPLDAFLREKESPLLGYFHFASPPWDPLQDAAWGYANETGRVRVIADTTNFHNPELAPLGPLRRKYVRRLQTALHWTKTYVKEAGATATFTVNKSLLTVFHPHWYDPMPGQPPGDIPPTPDDLPGVWLFMAVWLHRPELPPPTPYKLREEFWSEDQLVRDPPSVAPGDTADLVGGCVLNILHLAPAHHIWLCGSGFDRDAYASSRKSPLRPHPTIHDVDFSHLLEETTPYTGTIDLSGIRDGERYVIEYALIAEASSYGTIENWSSAFLGDPLDPQGGLSLEISSAPSPGKAPRICDVEADGARFTDHGDGTVTDGHTGLMWQRCPAGFSLDDAGTPGDMGDDRCTPSATLTPTWQGALQYAAGDSSASHDDWRLPDVKELDSIVELECRLPAIEPAPFPDTPPDTFWSATPGRQGAFAMAVSFATGSIQAEDKGSPAWVRLVRTSSQAPAPSLAGLRLGQPEPLVEDGVGAGGAALVFTLVLDRAASSEVAVSYHTEDDTARAGEDYVASSGTVIIPAGTRTATISVPVLADAVAEPPESFFLVLDQISGQARLAGASSTGVILDSQPRVEVTEAHVYEGDAGLADLAFLVTSSKPSPVDITVTYATSDGTATSSDYTPASGTVTIPAGLLSALVHVAVAGDTAVEGDEYLVLTLTGVSPGAALGAAASARGHIVEDDRPVAQALNDTGIGPCTNGSTFGACPQAGWPGQDGESGRDVTANVAIDGYRGFSFTKLDAAGTPLADQTQPYATTPWSCVRDEVTALVWEVKTNDGGLHDLDWTYTWLDSSGIGDGGSPGTPGGGTCFGSSCDTESFVAAVNASGWCGASDWRLPGREELRSLVVAKDGGFVYLGDPPWFPNTPGSHWSSTPSLDSTRARYFVQATAAEGAKSAPHSVRLVRGGI